MMERPPHATHHCRHYSYDRSPDDSGPKCASGVDLSAPGACRVCMPNAAEAVACDLREEFLPEEREAWERWRNERAGRMIEIIAQIPGSSRDKEDRAHWGESGAFPCPACEWGVVHWSRARVNGHLRAACTTRDCFGVIE
jgi:hypothetical protein